MISLIRDMGAVALNLITLSATCAWYAWMGLPVLATGFLAYTFYSFYVSTNPDAYTHSKFEGARAQRAAQATVEMVDWGVNGLQKLQMLGVIRMLVAPRLGVSRKRAQHWVRPAATDRRAEVQASMTRSILAASSVSSGHCGAATGGSGVSGIPRLRFGQLRRDPATNGCSSTDNTTTHTDTPTHNNNTNTNNTDENPSDNNSNGSTTTNTDTNPTSGNQDVHNPFEAPTSSTATTSE